MPKRNLSIPSTAMFSFDVGNGTCKALSSELREVIQFEPVIAPLTDRRGIQSSEEKPTFSLKADAETLVFGTDDVAAHGKRTAARRLNSVERYTSPDYLNLFKVCLLHGFAAYRGQGDYLAPIGVLSVPVSVYNDRLIIERLRNLLVGKHELVDHDGCTLRIDLQPRRLLILPESYGALLHATYEPLTMTKRPEADTSGTTLVVDIGYESTDFALFEGLSFQRDRAESVMRAGMGVLARAVQEQVERSVRVVDLSRIDRALREVAGKVSGSPKTIEPSPGVFIEIGPLYDIEIDHLADRIAQETLTRFPEAISRILLAGGGAYHLGRALREKLAPLTVELAPNLDLANVYGGFSALKLQQLRIATA